MKQANLMETFKPFAKRMDDADLPELVTKTFRYYYEQLVSGETGFLAEMEIEPLADLPDAAEFADDLAQVGEAALPRTVMIKLNGGLGTSMGMTRAKTLLPVKNNLTFLDIIARQVQQLGIPLVLMNSFATQADTLGQLKRYPALWKGNVPLEFLQHKVPKILCDTFQPADHPEDPDLTWNPPGHGDLYTALVTSGILDQLLTSGYEYAFISNGDNLGAMVDQRILGYFASGGYPFMMEAADRTPADRKGGHLAKNLDGQLILREIAQTPPEDEAAFQDISRHKYFNTNNLWVHLPTLKAVLAERDYVLGLPLIRNTKTLDPRKPDSPAVYQLETAMGSAIAVFQGAHAIRVPRTRFAPVKKTDDLLTIQSDAYVLTEDFRVVMNPKRKGAPLDVRLDERYYRLVDDMQARFPRGAPSLVRCESFEVLGDVVFGAGVIVQGRARVINEKGFQAAFPDHTILAGTVRLY